MKGSKRFGRQSCDCCGREFTAMEKKWNCPHCGFDNKQGMERAQHGARIASHRSAESRRRIPLAPAPDNG